MTDTPSRTLKIFLCHASADKPAVRKLYRYLRSKGMDPWLDVEKLLPGQRWQEEIPKALYASDAIIVCLSKNSVTKEGYVQREIKFALDKALDMPEGRIFLIPARLEECELPDSLKGYHWVDLFEKNWNRRLMSSLNERAAQLGLTLSSTTGETQPPVMSTPAISPAGQAQWVSPEDEGSSSEAKQPAHEVSPDKAEPQAIDKPDEKMVPLSEPELETRPPLPLHDEPKEEKFPEQQPRETGSSPVTQTKETSPRSRPEWKNIASRFNSRVLLGIGALLVVVSLGIAVFTALKNIIAPGIGSTKTGKDGMTLLYVPAGEFTMGNDNDSDDEKPVHPVTLDAFWIDKTEVTNKMYSQCVEAGVCEEPTNASSYTHSSYYGNSEFDDYPVIYVNWNMAKTYCEWADRRLPTEAEWEKAARGENANVYPWGNTFDGTLVNFCDTNCSFDWADKSSDDRLADVAPVGSYPNGASPYGALDMAGNVWELVSSLYQPYPYDPADGRENLTSSDVRALRGGSWDLTVYEVRSARRSWSGPAYTNVNIGFRCVFSESDPVQSVPLTQVATDTPSPTEASISATPALGIGTTIAGEDGMPLHYVPAGEFTMGSDSGSDDEKPVQTVNLDAFWIDQTEITNKMYSLCVEEGVCKEPTNPSSNTHSSYYGNTDFDNYPVIYVDWTMAKTYCQWADRRLPMEAEWEKAARGQNSNVYPWGNTFEASLANTCDKNCSMDWADKSSDDRFADVAPVGSYPDGMSVYGVLDMAGNVWEWVNDWYSESYYSISPLSNPEGPDSGQSRVLRGGSWVNDSFNVRSSDRNSVAPAYTLNSVGFRCAMSASP